MPPCWHHDAMFEHIAIGCDVEGKELLDDASSARAQILSAITSRIQDGQVVGEERKTT